MPPLVSRPAETTILITDRNLTVVGDPVDGWTDLDVTLRFNEPASGSFKAPADPSLVQLVQTGGYRVVVIRDGAIFVAGPIEAPGPEQWAASGEDSDPGTVEVNFTDDLALIAGHITYPNPAAAATAQTSLVRWAATANAETILRNLVNLNAGPGALTERRIPQLVLGAVQGVGTNASFSSRFEQLGDALRSVALAGGGLGFRTRQVGTTIEFQVYEPQDLTGNVRFSRGLGNLVSYSYEPKAPTATAAIVGGPDEGTARLIVERINTTAVTDWWRLETFVDQRQTEATSADTTELDQAGDEALARGAPTARLTSVTVDTPDQRFGVHYQLGDRVSIELNSAREVADVVRSVRLQSSPKAGELVTALIGSQEASGDPEWVTFTRDLARRLAGLETI